MARNQKEYDRLYYLRNKEKRLAQVKRWTQANPDKRLNNLLKSAYGIGKDEYDAMLVAQGGVCAICQGPPQRGRLVVDHNHETGAIRSLLCLLCNGMLGLSLDNPGILRQGAEYIEKHRAPALKRA